MKRKYKTKRLKLQYYRIVYVQGAHRYIPAIQLCITQFKKPIHIQNEFGSGKFHIYRSVLPKKILNYIPHWFDDPFGIDACPWITERKNRAK